MDSWSVDPSSAADHCTRTEKGREQDTVDQPNGLSPKGLSKGESVPLLPPPLGGGFGGVSVIITREIELSRAILVISGLIYCFLIITT